MGYLLFTMCVLQLGVIDCCDGVCWNMLYFSVRPAGEGAGLQQIKKPSRTVQPSQEFPEFQFLIMTSAEQRPNHPHPPTPHHPNTHYKHTLAAGTHSNYPSTTIITDKRRKVTGKWRERMENLRAERRK